MLESEYRDTAAIAVFLWQGFLDKFPHRSPQYEEVSFGELEMVKQMAMYAITVADVIEEIWQDRGEFPGVVEYEIVEPLGAWIGEQWLQNKTVTHKTLDEQARAQIMAWIVADKLTCS